TDYGVFLLGRIKEARDQGVDNRAAVAFGLERTGRIVSAAALLFVVAIGAFGASRVVSIKEVGLGTGLAVLIDATIVRALLVPSLVCPAGRWKWRAPPLRRALARVRRWSAWWAPRRIVRHEAHVIRRMTSVITIPTIGSPRSSPSAERAALTTTAS